MINEQTPIYNFKQINNRLAIGGQLDALEYAQLEEAGFEAIIQITIKDGEYDQANEEFLAHTHNMDYSAMGISFTNLSVAKIAGFIQLMEMYEDKKVYVHCTAGFYTSLLMVVYQMIRQGLDLETAIQKYTIDNWTLTSKWVTVIDRVMADRFKTETFAFAALS